MKNIYNALIVLTMTTLLSCNSHENTFISVKDNHIITALSALPDSSIAIEDLKEHCQKYPERWNAAFRFLTELDKDNLVYGRTDLSEHVYANIAAYETRPEQECMAEAHQRYIDIQYILSGQEYMAVTRDKTLALTTPYNEKDDYMFFAFQPKCYIRADSTRFFIFFPEDIHKPCVQMDRPEKVVKVVVKLQYD